MYTYMCTCVHVYVHALCYMACYVMLYCVIVRYKQLCPCMPYKMIYHNIQCYIMSCQIRSCHVIHCVALYFTLSCIVWQHSTCCCHFICVLYCIVFQYGITPSKYGRYGRYGILCENILSCSVLHRITLYYFKTCYLNRYQLIPG